MIPPPIERQIGFYNEVNNTFLDENNNILNINEEVNLDFEILYRGVNFEVSIKKFNSESNNLNNKQKLPIKKSKSY